MGELSPAWVVVPVCDALAVVGARIATANTTMDAKVASDGGRSLVFEVDMETFLNSSAEVTLLGWTDAQREPTGVAGVAIAGEIRLAVAYVERTSRESVTMARRFDVVDGADRSGDQQLSSG